MSSTLKEDMEAAGMQISICYNTVPAEKIINTHKKY
jgi:hypothetical protein